VAPATCADSHQARACAVPAGRWVAIAARDRALIREQEQVSTTAAFIAVILTSLLSTAGALVLARIAVRPLDRLARAVQAVPASERYAANLGSDVGVQEVDALRDTLASAFERLGRALTQSQSFAGHVAHQLRDPLIAIMRELDRALEVGGAAGDDERMRARRVAARLSGLVDRLLILASPHNRVAMETEMSVLEAVDEAIQTVPEPARSRISCEGARVTIRTDPALLVSAIASALENALKFSTGPIRVRIEPRADFVMLAIEDEGPGVYDRERSPSETTAPNGFGSPSSRA
jgi:signal transduction histidine kinase